MSSRGGRGSWGRGRGRGGGGSWGHDDRGAGPPPRRVEDGRGSKGGGKGCGKAKGSGKGGRGFFRGQTADRGANKVVSGGDRFVKSRRGGLTERGRGRGMGARNFGDQICREFQRTGNCARGASCKFKHESGTKSVQRVDAEFLIRHCQLDNAHSGAITNITMTPQGIYTVSQDKSLKRWQPQKQADGHFELKEDLTVPLDESCFSMLYKDGWIFCGLWDGSIKGFSQDGGNATMKGHTKRVNALIIHEGILISGAGDQSVKLWQMDPATKQFNCTHTVADGMPGAVNKLCVFGGKLMVGGSAGVAAIDLTSLTVKNILPPVKFVADFLEFQGHLIAAYSDGTMRVFDTEGNMQKELKESAAGPILSIAGLDSGPKIVCTHSRGQVGTIALPNFEHLCTFQAFDTGRVESVMCAGHDGIFLVGHQTGCLQLWQRMPPAGSA